MIKSTNLLQHIYLHAHLLHQTQVGNVCFSWNHGIMKSIISKTVFVHNHTYRIFSLMISSTMFLWILYYKFSHSSHQQSPFVMMHAWAITWIKFLSPIGFTIHNAHISFRFLLWPWCLRSFSPIVRRWSVMSSSQWTWFHCSENL